MCQKVTQRILWTCTFAVKRIYPNSVYVCACLCVCVCERMREREREGWENKIACQSFCQNNTSLTHHMLFQFSALLSLSTPSHTPSPLSLSTHILICLYLCAYTTFLSICSSVNSSISLSVRQSVRPSVRPSIRSFVRPSVRPTHSLCSLLIIFSRVCHNLMQFKENEREGKT
jgi:hypothetical protein